MNRPPIEDTNSNTGYPAIGNIPGMSPVASFNIDGVENLLATKGILATHYKSALNPARESLEMGANINLKAAERGVIYYEARKLLVIPQNISLNQSLQIQGMFSNQTVASLNVSGHYIDGNREPVYIKPRDLIILNETITTLAEQLVEYDPNGPLKTKFKVRAVERLFTQDRVFQLGTDFEVRQDRKIYWLAGQRPKFQQGKGQIISLCYFISPTYVVNNVPHSLRIIPSNPMGSGGIPREAVYAPQQIICVQSHLTEETDYLDLFNLPAYLEPNSGPNTNRG